MVASSGAPRSLASLRTLAIDIGGTGLKALVLDASGDPITPRERVETPSDPTPQRVLAALGGLVKKLGEFERVSCGFPGVVMDGVVKTAPNLGTKAWANYALARTFEQTWKRPARVLNDAGVQGYGVVDGHGVEMLLTFGTGMGCAVFNDGKYVPNLELAHHPFRKGKTYEQRVCNAEYERKGRKKWNRRVQRILEQIDPIWNPRRIYLGGGNAKHITFELPAHVVRTENIAGLLGGIRLWGAWGESA